jgi:hypothetical protein
MKVQRLKHLMHILHSHTSVILTIPQIYWRRAVYCIRIARTSAVVLTDLVMTKSLGIVHQPQVQRCEQQGFQVNGVTLTMIGATPDG